MVLNRYCDVFPFSDVGVSNIHAQKALDMERYQRISAEERLQQAEMKITL